MRLRVDDITAEAKELAFEEPEAQVNALLERRPPQEYRIEGPISVTISCYRAGTDLFFAGDLHASTHATCARCTDDSVRLIDRSFRFILTPRVVGLNDDNIQAEDLELSVYDGEEVDLAPLIREQFLLALPTRPLCADECRGLCPHCGANRNMADCGCRTESLDPRFAVLRSLKLGRS